MCVHIYSCIYICVCVYIYIYGERFIIRNLLTWVWGLVKSAACGAGDTGRVDVQVQRPSVRKSQYCWWNPEEISWRILSNSRENWSFCSNLTCNWLDEAILHYGEQSASLKVLWFQCQSRAKTLSQIPWDNTWPLMGTSWSYQVDAYDLPLQCVCLHSFNQILWGTI